CLVSRSREDVQILMGGQDRMSKARAGRRPWLWLVLALVVAAPLAPAVFRADRAAAQSGWWPWASEPEPPQRRPPPVRREPEPTWRPPAGTPHAGGQYPAQRGSVCLQLEQ